MNPRALLTGVLLLSALAAGEEPARDFDAEAEAFSWSLRPRREIVEGLAERLRRGEAKGWAEAAMKPPVIPAVPSRLPADFDFEGVPVTDRLAAWVPADAAAVFFSSLREAEDLVAGMADFLPRALPGLCGDSPGGRREALRRAAERLLLPTIWGANPGVRTGTRQVALVAADPDLRWGADVAFLAEVDDASLVEFHRRSSMRWEDRGSRVLRVEGLDVVSDDGSIRSFFGMRGGVAVWSTTRDLRDRILAAGEGRADSLLRPDRRAWALARRTFPASGGGALLVVPDGFLARANAAGTRAKRAAALRCEAARRILDARSVAAEKVSQKDTLVLACPAGGVLRPVAGKAGASCSLHGTAADPVPLGDLPEAAPVVADRFPAHGVDALAAGAVPVALRYPAREEPLHVDGESPARQRQPREDSMELLVPLAPTGGRLVDLLRTACPEGWIPAEAPAVPAAGGVLRVSLLSGGGGSSGGGSYRSMSLLLEWR